MADPDPKSRTSRRQAKPAEFERFRDLTKRLVSVPKKEINGQPERKPAKKSR
jgi:hypothetical protein